MMRKSLALLLFMTFACCSRLTFEDNTRLYISGQVIDESGQALPNISVEAYGLIDSSLLFGGDDRVIGFSMTDAEGFFAIVAIAPNNEDRLVISINTKDSRMVSFNRRYVNRQLEIEVFTSIDDVEFNSREPIVLEQVN